MHRDSGAKSLRLGIQDGFWKRGRDHWCTEAQLPMDVRQSPAIVPRLLLLRLHLMVASGPSLFLLHPCHSNAGQVEEESWWASHIGVGSRWRLSKAYARHVFWVLLDCFSMCRFGFTWSSFNEFVWFVPEAVWATMISSTGACWCRWRSREATIELFGSRSWSS